MGPEKLHDINPAVVPAFLFLALGAVTLRLVTKEVLEIDSNIRKALHLRQTTRPASEPTKE